MCVHVDGVPGYGTFSVNLCAFRVHFGVWELGGVDIICEILCEEYTLVI